MEKAGKSKNRRGRHGWDINPPTRWRKPHPIRKNLVLEMAIIGIAHPQHPWYRMEYKVFIGADVFVNLGEIDWSDWDQRGDLVFAKVGRLFRQPLGESLTAKTKQIADFRSLKFQNVPPP